MDPARKNFSSHYLTLIPKANGQPRVIHMTHGLRDQNHQLTLQDGSADWQTFLNFRDIGPLPSLNVQLRPIPLPLEY